MRQQIVLAALALVALIHLLPLPGVLGATQLQALYDLDNIDATSLLLLRHRAMMFALFAALLLVAMRNAVLRPIAISLVLLSDIGFLCIALVGGLPDALMPVVIADVVAIALLVIAAAAQRNLRSPSPGASHRA